MNLSATAAIVRYGASLVLHVLLEVDVGIIDRVPSLYISIVNCCVDPDQNTRELCLAILLNVARYKSLDDLADLIRSHKHRVGQVSVDALHVRLAPS